MERLIKAKEILGSSWSSCNNSYRKLACLTGLQVIFLLTVSVLLISCTTIKKAGVTAIAAGGGATVATVLSGGAAAPILGATTGAFVGDVATEVMMSDKSKGMTVPQMKKGELMFALLMILFIIGVPLMLVLWANHTILGEI